MHTGISSSNLLLVLGDLNARVGLQSRDSDVWSNVLGHFGIDDINQAGEDLLSFTICSEATLFGCTGDAWSYLLD